MARHGANAQADEKWHEMKNPDGSWDRFDDYVLDFALEQMRRGAEVALVTLIGIEGASPRPLGAQMAVTGTGEWAGYLSGGCIERAVVAEAQAALQKGEPRIVRYGRGSQYMDIQLPCGSAIDLLFEVHPDPEQLAAVDASLAERRPAMLRIGERCSSPVLPVARRYLPRRRLVVAGTGPAAGVLARLARDAGYATELHSPDGPTREAAEARGVPAASVEPGRHALHADRWTAIAFLFHDHEWERDLIPAALVTDAFYIGAMGSRRTHMQRLQMLEGQGIDAGSLARIHGPAGLFAGARSASDIALSILAEIARAETQHAAPLLEPLAGEGGAGAMEEADPIGEGWSRMRTS